MTKYYLSGPMRGYPEYNFPAFIEACKELRGMGLEIVSPHEKQIESTAPLTAELYNSYLREDIKLITECGGIILLKGWPKSQGAKLELQVALGLGLTVMCYVGGQLLNMEDYFYGQR